MNLGNELVVGGAVETILRQIALDSSITMYQVEATGGQISVLVEATGAGTQSGGVTTPASAATAIQTRIALLGNIGATGNVWANLTTVSTSTNFKIA